MAIGQRRSIAAAGQLGGGRRKVAIERLLQLVHQLLDLGLRRAALQRLHQPLPSLFQPPLGEWHVALLHPQRRFPEQIADRGYRPRAFIQAQTGSGDGKRQRDHRIIAELSRLRGDPGELRGDRPALSMIYQPFAQRDEGARHGMLERTFRQHHLDRLAAAGLSRRVLRLQVYPHRQPRERVVGEVPQTVTG